MNVWVLLGLSIAAEIAGTSFLKMSDGFKQPLWGVASQACYLLCFWMMSFVLTRIPMGVTYAIWSGIGIVAITLIGWLAFRQALSLAQIVCMVLQSGCICPRAWRTDFLLIGKVDSRFLHFLVRQQPDQRLIVQIHHLDAIAEGIAEIAAEAGNEF